MLPLVACLALGVQDIPADLLGVWRKPDAQGLACASCHSPDGIELAAFNFTDDNVRRRASHHLSSVDTSQILALLNLQRKRFPKPLDPLADRPMQPGGRVLPGGTPADRDVAFAQELERRARGFTTTPIKSLTDAKRMRDALLAIDLRSLPIGIEFNRLSEDGFHGKQHRTIAHWIPDTPLNVSNEAQDRYLAAPTEQNLRALDAAVIAANPLRLPFDAISLNKYRSLLIEQHRLRGGTLRTPLGTNMTANPMWLLADLTRIYKDQTMMPFPAQVAANKEADLLTQGSAIRLPWFWMGWMEDSALTRSGFDPETVTGHYFVESLFDDGPYPVHALFVATKRMVDLGWAPNAWTSTRERHPEIQYSSLKLARLLEKGEPKEPNHKRIYRVTAANSFWMMLWLLDEDLGKTKKSIRPESQIGQIRYVSQALGLDKSADSKLVARVISRLNPTRN